MCLSKESLPHKSVLVCLDVHEYGNQRLTLDVLLNLSSLYFLRQGLAMSLESDTLDRLVVQ